MIEIAGQLSFVEGGRGTHWVRLIRSRTRTSPLGYGAPACLRAVVTGEKGRPHPGLPRAGPAVFAGDL